MEANRTDLRRQMRHQRRSLSAQQRHRAAVSLERNLACLPLFLHSRHIAFYLPNDGEIDLTPLIQRAWQMGKRCYLPNLSPLYHNRLWFAPFTHDSTLILNRFGIPEPACNWREMRNVRSLDLIIAPLVAFDDQGNRLGMGGGFYDRTLAYLAHRTAWHKPRLFGAAYAFQQVTELPHQPWDVPLEGIVTDNGTIFRR
ncbi:5-formyltetrahydrofolate cyclo-ligase [Sedimenticola sp.]|uniref:5-formyltetrahydrofolate cyclo-ligase n=1 Tax=Sedimenticola sp. TaxID=1940285 RepID=UPI003D0B5A48